LSISPSCQQTFGGVILRKLTASGCLRLPPTKARDSIFYDGSEVARENNVPSCGNKFALVFSGQWLIGEDFFRRGLVGEKSERWGSNFNESTNLWWRFFNGINRIVNLAPQMKEGLSKLGVKLKF